MAIIAELFDGTRLEFPDNTDQGVISATVQRLTLERQSGNVATPEVEDKGSPAYQTIKSLVDPLRPAYEKAADYGKLFTAPVAKGIAGIPEGVEAFGGGAARETAFKPTEVLNYLSNPEQLANDFSKALGLPSIFQQKNRDIVTKKQLDRQKAELDKTLTRGKIESFRNLSEYGSEIAKKLEDSVSPEMKEALANTEPTGNIIKALETGDFSEISLGKDPSLYGLSGQAVKVFGSTAPVILSSIITKSPTVGTVVGTGQAAAEGVDTAREYISKMSDEELAKKSEYYRNLLVLGYNPKEARRMTEQRAGDTAALYQGSVGALGSAFTSNLVTGKFDKMLLEGARNKLTRILGGGAVGMTEEGVQELAEGVASDLGINKSVVRELGVDSFANLVLGALGGGAPGAVRGAIAKPEEKAAPQEEPQVEPIVTPTAPEEQAVSEAAPSQAEEFMAQAYAGQDIQAMMDELEGRERKPKVEEVVAEEVKAEEAPKRPSTSEILDNAFMWRKGNVDVPIQVVAERIVSDSGRREVVALVNGQEVNIPIDEIVAKPEYRQAAAQEKTVEPEIKQLPAGQAATFVDLTPEDRKIVREMEVAKNKIAKEKKLFPEFLRRQGIQPSEKADLGLEKFKRPGIFKVTAPSFDELTSRAIAEGFMMDSGDDVQNVANFREYVSDYLNNGVINTGPDASREGQIKAIEDEIDRIYKKYEAPTEEFGLEETTPEQLRAEEQARLDEQESIRLAEEQQRRDQERQEIAQLSERAAEDFQLGRTAEEDLMGQTSIFEQPTELTDEQIDAEMRQLAERSRAEAERMRREGDEDADIPFYGPTMARENDTAQDAADARNQEIREEKIRELQSIKQKLSAITRRFISKRSKKQDMFWYEELYKTAGALEQEIYELYEPNLSPEAFLARAAKELAAGTISREVYDVIDAIYKKSPQLLEGLRLSIKKRELAGAAGQFLPYERIVRLYKGTEGVEDPRTIRHEITHTLEQMMSRDARRDLAKRWRQALEKAAKAEKGEQGKAYFEKVNEFIKNPNKETFEAAMRIMPDYSYYQYLAPSEYWAINAEELMASYLGGGWQRFKAAVRALFEKIKDVLGIDNDYIVHRVFREVIKSGQRKTSSMINDYIQATVPLYNPHRNYLGGQPPLATWNSPDQESKIANFIYKIQDKMIDLKDVQKAITQAVGQIRDDWNAYMKEELYHGRSAKRIEDFLKNELTPILKDMKSANIDIQDFDDYLHNRHAEERNIQIAKVNPNMPDAGSGISTADAKAYMAALDPAKRRIFEQLAKKVDLMVQGTQKILVNEGLEEQSTIDAWNGAYKHYVPLMREDLDFVHAGSGFGQGYGTRGKTSRRATGSLKDVADIFANIAMQRERAIIRAEKARVGRALYGLAIKNPNPGFWLPVNPDAIKDPQALANELISLGLSPQDAMNFIKEPTTQDIDPRTGLVVNRVNVNNRYSDNVFPVKVNGKDRFIFFNPSDPRALRMIKSLKNMDVDNLSEVVGTFARVTRWIASMNTQYNPVFGAWNFVRDYFGGSINLSTTPIADKRKQILIDTFPAMRAIYKDLRLDRKGGQSPAAQWNQLFERFQKAGGQTGYRDQFSKNKRHANIIERELDNLNKGNTRKFVDAVGGWLSDYNDAMENAVRLAAFKAALDKGFSEERAASIAKNLTVNFNRKGQLTSNVNALYAFFNAAVQGTARIYETLTGPAGKKIIAGGMLLGAIQALALAMAGFDDDEPPEYLKDKNLIIPVGGKKYVVIPMPLGFSAIPGMGRRLTEMVLTGGDNMPKKMIGMMGMVLDAFNPLGSGSFAQMLLPTIADPFAAISANRDPFGRPIYKEDKATNPTPGYSRSRETASTISKGIAEFLNWASGGTQFKKGAISPTADEIDYLVGQYTGGVGREIQKAAESGKALFTGEKVPPYRKPIVGKIVGDGDSPQAVQNKFYSNITELAQHENEIKGRMKNRMNVTEYYREYPEARMYSRANQVENQITELNKERKELIQKKAPQYRIDAIDKRKETLMRQFNNQYKARKQ